MDKGHLEVDARSPGRWRRAFLSHSPHRAHSPGRLPLSILHDDHDVFDDPHNPAFLLCTLSRSPPPHRLPIAPSRSSRPGHRPPLTRNPDPPAILS